MIKFGTSGWRAVMGEEFTFQNVRLVIQAVANYLKKKYPDQKISVIVNYDTRFLSERFAFEAAKILSHNMIHVYLSDRDAPSQAQAFQIISRKAQAGINFTIRGADHHQDRLCIRTGHPTPQTTSEFFLIKIGRKQDLL